MTRVEYVHDEDVKIVKFLARHDAWELTNGNRIWMLMEKENTCPKRTFQSLRNRFLRSIKPRLLTDFSSIVNTSPLPRRFKKTLPQSSGLRNKLEKVKKDVSPVKHKSRKENVSPTRPDSPSMVDKLPIVRNNKKKSSEIVDSCEIDGWTVPHCVASPEKPPDKLKKRRLYNDSYDVFLDEEDEQENNPKEQEPASSSETPQDVHEVENVSQEMPFVSLNEIPSVMTQIVCEEVHVENNKEPEVETVPPAEGQRNHRFSAVWKKRRRRIEQHRRFQRRIQKISDQLLKNRREMTDVRNKHQRLVSFITSCFQETSHPEISELVVKVADGDQVCSSLLQNMLQSLDEDSRKKILELSQHAQIGKKFNFV